jgi:PDZ domain
MKPSELSDYLVQHSDRARVLTIIKAPPLDTITIVAPSGKLGINIESTPDIGPRIKMVHNNSPLLNRIYVGDLIVSVDGQNTKNQNSKMIADYLSMNATNEERVIVVQRVKILEVTEEEEHSEGSTTDTADDSVPSNPSS